MLKEIFGIIFKILTFQPVVNGSYFVSFLIWIAIISLILLIIPGLIERFNKLYIKLKTKEIKEEQVLAIVTQKCYIPAYSSISASGSLSRRDSCYEVYLTYFTETFCIDSKKLYKNVKVGTKVPIILLSYITKKGKVIKTEFELV